MHGTEFCRLIPQNLCYKKRIFSILFLMQLTAKIIIIEEIIEIFYLNYFTIKAFCLYLSDYEKKLL